MEEPDIKFEEAKKIKAMETTLEAIDLIVGEDAEIGVLANQHEQLRALEGKVESTKKEIALRIVQKMEAMGVDAVKAGGRRLGFREQTYYGCAEGRNDDLKDFIEAVAPECLVPASTNIKKALDAWLDRNPGQNVPDFISVSKTRSLVNAKA